MSRVIQGPPPSILSNGPGNVQVKRKGLDTLHVKDLVFAEAMGGGDWFVTVGKGPSMLRISINRRGRVTVVERDDGKPIK